ncbi:tyrosine--tRNA ligase [Candidatus Parvarchaeota archaeon]|nr:tyrosine--tRNA ligase [Candidatus Parvarchaeota archaeon]
MDIERKIELAARKPVSEVITRDELRQVFEAHAHPKHYIGFEISGSVHLGSGLMTALKIRDLLEAGVKPTIFLADYHSWINGKLGGDLEQIRAVAQGYFKSAFVSLGLEEGKVNYVLASQLYDNDYWADVLAISKSTTIARMLRCTTIMGRTAAEATYCSSTLYPAMQAADIFALGVQIAHSGTDQRKVHMLARECADKLGAKSGKSGSVQKPVAIHGHLLMGLQGPTKMGFEQNEKEDIEISSKMSKSKPETCIYIHDSEDEIKKKISKAYCPEKQVENNPIIELAEYAVMRDGKSALEISRPAKFGGDIIFATVEELKGAYSQGKLHPMDLKAGVGDALAKLLKPSRDYFAKRPELIEQVQQAKVSR